MAADLGIEVQTDRLPNVYDEPVGRGDWADVRRTLVVTEMVSRNIAEFPELTEPIPSERRQLLRGLVSLTPSIAAQQLYERLDHDGFVLWTISHAAVWHLSHVRLITSAGEEEYSDLILCPERGGFEIAPAAEIPADFQVPPELQAPTT